MRIWIPLALAVVACVLGRPAAPETESAGGWIAYWRSSPIPSIWAVRPSGTQNHRILRTGQNAKRPRLSPDRKWVAFDGTPPGKPALSDFDIQIVRMNGTDRRTLTRSPAWDIDAQWSPNGQWLTFTRSPPHPTSCTDHSIWIIRRDGSDARHVAPGCGARWSPAGKKLVYASTDGRRLLVIDAAGGKSRLLLRGPAGAFESPAGWSPNGKKILFTREVGEEGSLYVMNADGTQVRRLSGGFAGSWSPDGKKILYTKSFSRSLSVMNADGLHRRQVLPGEASEPNWR